MKVLLIAPCNSIHTIRWVTRLKKSGIETQVYNSAEEEELLEIPKEILLQPSKVKIHINPQSRFFSKYIPSLISDLLIEYKRIKIVIETFQPDIIHVHWLLSPSALAIVFLNFKKIVISPWGSDVLPSINTAAMLFVVFPLTFVLTFISPNKNSKATFEIV